MRYRKFSFYSSKTLQNISNRYASFDGVNDYIRVPDSASLKVIGNQTIEFWFRPKDVSQRKSIIHKAYGGEFAIYQDYGGKLRYWYGTVGKDGGAYNTEYQDISTVTALENNTWYHCAVVRDFTSAQISWIINGVKESSNGTLFTQASVSTSPVLIGSGFRNVVSGDISEMRIWNVAKTLTEIQSGMNTTITTPQTGLVANYCLNGNALDSSGNNLHGTEYNGVTYSPYFRKYATFDGVNDYIDLTAQKQKLYAVGASVTVEGWIKPAASHLSSSSLGVLLSFREGTNSEFHLWYGGNVTSSLNYELLTIFYTNTSTGNGYGIRAVTDSDNTPYFNKWFHFAFVLTPTSWKIYINGIEKPLDIPNSSPLTRLPIGHWGNYTTSGNSTVSIGQRGNNTAYFRGDMDDFRIWNKEFSPSEVVSAMNNTVGNSSLVAHYQFNSDTKDSSANNIHGTEFNGLTYGRE